MLESQVTVSTANTGSLTPPGGSSTADGRPSEEGGGDAKHSPPVLEPLTQASTECCSPQVIFAHGSITLFRERVYTHIIGRYVNTIRTLPTLESFELLQAKELYLRESDRL